MKHRCTPDPPSDSSPLHHQAGCGCWSAASAVSTGGRLKQRERRRSDYASEAQRMTWSELRAARQLAGAPTLIRKISNWWEANVRTTRSPPPCRSSSHHSCSYCFSVGFHRLTWLGCGSNLARPPWQPASERLFNQSCNAPGFKSHQLPSSGDKSKKQQLLAALIWVPSSRKKWTKWRWRRFPVDKILQFACEWLEPLQLYAENPLSKCFLRALLLHGCVRQMQKWDHTFCLDIIDDYMDGWNFMKLATGRCFSPSLCGALMFTDDTDTMLPAAFQKHKIRYLHSSLTLLHSLDSIWQGRSVMLRIRHAIVDEIMNVGLIAMLRLHRHQACLKSHKLVCEASVLLSAEMKRQDLFCFIPFLRPNLNLKLD